MIADVNEFSVVYVAQCVCLAVVVSANQFDVDCF